MGGLGFWGWLSALRESFKRCPGRQNEPTRDEHKARVPRLKCFLRRRRWRRQLRRRAGRGPQAADPRPHRVVLQCRRAGLRRVRQERTLQARHTLAYRGPSQVWALCGRGRLRKRRRQGSLSTVHMLPVPRRASQREAGLPQARALARALGFPSLPEPSCLRRDLPEDIAAAKTDFHAAVQQQRKTKLKAWKDNILHEPGALGRWLRNRQAPPVTRVTTEGSSADSPLQERP